MNGKLDPEERVLDWFEQTFGMNPMIGMNTDSILLMVIVRSLSLI